METFVELFDTMIVNREFFDSVTDAGVRVWANSGFFEFVEALDIYSTRYPEIKLVCRLFNHLETGPVSDTLKPKTEKEESVGG